MPLLVSSLLLPLIAQQGVTPPHLDITVTQEQVHDDVWAKMLHRVQSLLDLAQFVAQVRATEPLTDRPDLLPDFLLRVLAAGEDAVL